AKIRVNCGQSSIGLFFHIVISACNSCIVTHQQGFSIRCLVVDRNTHIAKGGDDTLYRIGIDQIIWQMIVDRAIGEIATLFAELNQGVEAITTRFLFLGCELATATKDIAGTSAGCLFGTFTCGLRLGDLFGLLVVYVVLVEIVKSRCFSCLLGRLFSSFFGCLFSRCFLSRLNCFFSRLFGCGFFRCYFLGCSFLCCLFSCLLGSLFRRFLCYFFSCSLFRCRLFSRFFCSGFFGYLFSSLFGCFLCCRLSLCALDGFLDLCRRAFVAR